ncbi:hypothetical protein GCK32_013453, partial [Trichostrongylus colubriformis]
MESATTPATTPTADVASKGTAEPMKSTTSSTSAAAAKQTGKTPAPQLNKTRSQASKPPVKPKPNQQPNRATQEPQPKRKRQLSSSSDSSSSSSSENDLPLKKGRASGTILKELLKQGSKILLLAASKVDQLAPAVTVSHSQEMKEQLERLEQMMKCFHEQTSKMQKANEEKIDKITLKMELFNARLSQMEKGYKEKAKSADNEENDKWKQVQEDIKQMREEFSLLNASQLSSDIRNFHERFNEFISRASDIDARRTPSPMEPSPELSRIRRQMEETEKELQAVRRETLDVNHSIERAWRKDRGMAAVDDLKEKRQRLQSKESRLQQEMRDLQGRLEREIGGRPREEDSSSARGRSYTQEMRKDRGSSRERHHWKRREDRRESRQHRRTPTPCDRKEQKKPEIAVRGLRLHAIQDKEYTSKLIAGSERLTSNEETLRTKTHNITSLVPRKQEGNPRSNARRNRLSGQGVRTKRNCAGLEKGKAGEESTDESFTHINKDEHAGQAQVINPVTQELEAVHIMLDTGADRSFISNDLADRLHLQNVSSQRLTISTFGSHTPMVKTCGVTVLKLWDAQGVPHSFTVTKIDTVTGSLQRSSLSLEDKRFLCDHDLRLSIHPTTSDIRPQILLGCADLFSLLNNGLAPQYVLPSGLQLIPSRLGYLVAGRGVRITLNAVTMPPTPELSSTFISDGVQLALWRRERKPSLVFMESATTPATTPTADVASKGTAEPMKSTTSSTSAAAAKQTGKTPAPQLNKTRSQASKPPVKPKPNQQPNRATQEPQPKRKR